MITAPARPVDAGGARTREAPDAWDERAVTVVDPPAAEPVATGRVMAADRGVGRPALLVLALLAVALALHITVISALQHQADQVEGFAELRSTLAEGTAPISAVGRDKRLLALGTPVALLEIPAIGLREVVREGTTPGVLASGPAHRRDTPLPGQRGTSEVFGRKAAYGGPFKRLDDLAVGDRIKVTTGQGVATFKVARFRVGGDPIPASAENAGRLTLVTASGTMFVPAGVRWVDADLVGQPFATPARAIAAGSLPDGEKPLGTDGSTVWALVLWLQALVAVTAGAVWSWMRWGRHQTWIVFGPLVVVVGLAVAGQVTRLLPNLL